MSENKVNGPEDVVVSEMIKQLPQEKIYEVTRCFQQRCMGQMDAPNSWKIVKLVFLRKPDAAPKKGIKSYRAIALTSVMSKWYATCLIQLLEKEKEPEAWKDLLVGGINGISCQHLQVMMTLLLQKHWVWQEDREKGTQQGSERIPTEFLASMDIRTTFDIARPKTHCEHDE